MWNYKLLKPEALWFLPSDAENPGFTFSLDGKSDEEIQQLVDDGVIQIIE